MSVFMQARERLHDDGEWHPQAAGFIAPSPPLRSVVAWVWGSTPEEAERAASALRAGVSGALAGGYRVTRIVTAVGCPERSAERTGLDPADLVKRRAFYDQVIEFYRMPPTA